MYNRKWRTYMSSHKEWTKNIINIVVLQILGVKVEKHAVGK